MRRITIWLCWRAGWLRKAMNVYAFRRVIGEAGRIEAWRRVGVKIEAPVRIGAGVQIPHNPHVVSIGSGSKLTGNIRIVARKPITIGRNVIFNDEIYLVSGGHDPDSPRFGGASKPISIGDYAWLPIRVTVLSGVTIGRAAVIGSGSVVVKDVPDYGIAVGNPARVVKKRAEVDFTYVPAAGKWS